MTNTVKHAAARRITITLRVADGSVTLTVADDGSGDVDVHAGTGITGIADRIAALGGRLDVDATPGTGTVITAVLALRRPSARSAVRRAGRVAGRGTADLGQHHRCRGCRLLQARDLVHALCRRLVRAQRRGDGRRPIHERSDLFAARENAIMPPGADLGQPLELRRPLGGRAARASPAACRRTSCCAGDRLSTDPFEATRTFTFGKNVTFAVYDIPTGMSRYSG